MPGECYCLAFFRNRDFFGYGLGCINCGFNPGFITDALKVIDSGDVIIELKASNKPGSKTLLITGQKLFKYSLVFGLYPVR